MATVWGAGDAVTAGWAGGAVVAGGAVTGVAPGLASKSSVIQRKPLAPVATPMPVRLYVGSIMLPKWKGLLTKALKTMATLPPPPTFSPSFVQPPLSWEPTVGL